MKLFYLASLLIWLLQIPQPPQKVVLDVNEITSQLGIATANLNIEQRYTKALQAENAELRKKLTLCEKPVPAVPKIDIPEGHMPGAPKESK